MDNVNIEALQEIKDLLTPAEEVKNEPVVEEVIEEAIEEPIEEVVNPDEEQNDDEEEIDQPHTSEGLEEEPYTMKSLADAIEIDQSDLYGVMVPMGAGEEPISIGDIKNKYTDLIRDNAALTAKVSEQTSQMEQGVTSQQQVQESSQAEIQAQVEMAQIQQEYNGIDWADMEQYEPGKAALARQKLQERYQAAQQTLAVADQARTTEQQNVLAAAQTKMAELIPSWSDNAKKVADIAVMSTAMTEAGYSADMVNNVYDPIAMMLMQELITLRAEKAKGQEAVKQVRRAPKVLNSGGPARVKTNKTDDLVNKAKASGDKNDAFAAVKALMNG